MSAKKGEDSVFWLTIFWIVALGIILILSSCTEEVIKEVIVERVRVDTVSKTKIIIEKDTVLVVVIDSVFSVKTITEYDTITQIQHNYHEKQYVFPGNGVYSVPEELQYIVNQFTTDAQAHGLQPIGGNLLITPWTYLEAPPEDRSSYSYYYWDQYTIKLKDTIDPDHCFTPIYRELAWLWLDIPYSNKPDEIMHPEFDPYKLTLDSPEAQEYIDKLFER